MLPPRCFTCGHVLANLELEFEEKLQQIDNNINLTTEAKAKNKCELVDKLLPDRWKKRYCCRSRLISYVDLINVVI
jgi:DNA-directed RNA polymerase subunit N (RpoN/RPB10)